MPNYVRLSNAGLATLCISLTFISSFLTYKYTLSHVVPLKRDERQVINHSDLLSALPASSTAETPAAAPQAATATGADAEVNPATFQVPTPDIDGALSILPDAVIRDAGKKALIRYPKKNELLPRGNQWSKLVQTSAPTSEKMMSRPPTAILLGFAKCGTSALLQFLQLHPKIAPLDWEPDYFCDRMYKKYDLKWYIEKMPPSTPDMVTVEKSPCYIVEHDSHLRMHAMNSSLKVMVLVRDPITRMLSEHAHFTSCQKTWGIRYPTFKERFTNKSSGGLNTDMVLKQADYEPHLKHLISVFPRDQILIIDGDKLITEPLSQLARVEQFIGVPHMITEKNIYFDKKKGFYCMRGLDGKDRCMGDSKGREHEKVDPEFLKKVSDYLKPYKESFFQTVGVRFDWQ